MKIGIVEFMYHHIFLYSLSSVAMESGADVTIFTTRNLYDLVAPLFKDKIKNYRWIIKDEDEKLWSFLRRVEKLANKEIDLLFVNTLQVVLLQPLYPLSYISFKPQCKSILITGRATEWFGSKYQFFPFLSIKGFLKHNMMHFLVKRVLPRYDAVVVHTRALKDYVLATGYKKDVFILPFSIYEGNAAVRINRKKIRFVVLGSIAKHRRDYNGVLNAFERLWRNGRDDIALAVVGQPIGMYGRKIINRCRFLKKQGFDIRFFNEYIPEQVFVDEVVSADVIINPLRVENYQYGGFTAGLVDAIRHAKPGIYPSGYVLPEEVLSSSIYFNEIEELPHLIGNKFLNNGGLLEKLSENAIANSEKFSLQQATNYFQESLLKKILPYSMERTGK